MSGQASSSCARWDPGSQHPLLREGQHALQGVLHRGGFCLVFFFLKKNTHKDGCFLGHSWGATFMPSTTVAGSVTVSGSTGSAAGERSKTEKPESIRDPSPGPFMSTPPPSLLPACSSLGSPYPAPRCPSRLIHSFTVKRLRVLIREWAKCLDIFPHLPHCP